MNGMPTGVRNREQRAGAGSSHVIDRNVLLLKHVQHAQVRDAPRESAAKRHANPGPARRLDGDWLRVREITNAVNRVLQPFPDVLFVWASHLLYKTILPVNWIRGVSR